MIGSFFSKLGIFALKLYLIGRLFMVVVFAVFFLI